MASVKHLPNGAITTITVNESEIYTYAQLSTVKLVEIISKIDRAYSSTDWASANHSGMMTARRFTTLAAATYNKGNIKELKATRGTTLQKRYLFYINDSNLLMGHLRAVVSLSLRVFRYCKVFQISDCQDYIIVLITLSFPSLETVQEGSVQSEGIKRASEVQWSSSAMSWILYCRQTNP